ncbi:site-specific DNA-methyltransferase [Thermosynechococcaceae cyanobacterium BACA0444]|uniref:Methyltransferase n=1 Tax=Pseudocalidococcus azoricus BACA0444 TaxID=2918990 RepID=A0AAE4FUM3_9CYAN|nr:site-specific DNA-methyltransferase [Pseudocalidococcus azoricus]MDS3861205.1 site-specific DNA-methyltransferase [Pseudocalidococcus azoricus BACA0444]
MKKGSRTRSFGSSQRINHDASGYYESKLYQDLKHTPQAYSQADLPFPNSYLDKTIHHSSEKMSELPDNCLHLMITSPPYNVSKTYDLDLSLAEYLDLLKSVFQETYRVLTHGGRACINVANLGRKPYIPLSDYISQMMLEIGFLMRGEIIWQKGAGAGGSMAWGSWQSASNPVLRDTHEYILVFSKGTFARKKQDRENTITKDQFMEWTKSVWTMNPESARKVGHPAPFPIELPFRLIQLYSYKNDVILDPFMGSGSTAIAAITANRHYVGYELDQHYIDLANIRLEPYLLKATSSLLA